MLISPFCGGDCIVGERELISIRRVGDVQVRIEQGEDFRIRVIGGDETNFRLRFGTAEFQERWKYGEVLRWIYLRSVEGGEHILSLEGIEIAFRPKLSASCQALQQPIMPC